MALTTVRSTGISSLPAISAANLTSIPAANITGTLPAISGANLTGIVTTNDFEYINGYANASEHSNVTIDNCFTSTYHNYLVMINATIINGSNGIRLVWQFRNGGASGADYSGDNTHFVSNYHDSNNNQGHYADEGSGSTWQFGGSALGNASNNYTYSGMMYVFGPNEGSFKTNLMHVASSTNWSGYNQVITGSCRLDHVSAMTGFKISATADNLKHSNIRVYGMRDS